MTRPKYVPRTLGALVFHQPTIIERIVRFCRSEQDMQQLSLLATSPHQAPVECWVKDRCLFWHVFYVNGKREGLYEEWYESGQLKERGNYHNDRRHGVYERWYGDGQPCTRGNFKNGNREGLYEAWCGDGILYLREHFHNDKFESMDELE